MRPVFTTLIALALAAPAVAQEQSIVQIVASTPELQTLYSTLKASGLDKELRKDGPYTLFAPSDEAFAKLPEETVEGLLRPENQEQIARTLKTHVVMGKFPALEVHRFDGQEVTTMLEGHRVPITVQGEETRFGKAQVTETDIEASNGLIHIIDTVLMPESE